MKLGEKEAEELALLPYYRLQRPEDGRWRERCSSFLSGIYWQNVWKWLKGVMGSVQTLTLGEKKHFLFSLFFFAKSAVGHLNGLPREVVDASCLSVFKWHLDNALNGIS